MRKIIVIGFAFLLIGILSGCLEDAKPKVKYREGFVSEIVHQHSFDEWHFIFADDTVFSFRSDVTNRTYFESYVGKKVRIRYYEDTFGNNYLIDISEVIELTINIKEVKKL